MPVFQSTPDLEMFYQVDDFTDPWSEPETILMLHGNCESHAAWYAWVPHLGFAWCNRTCGVTAPRHRCRAILHGRSIS